MAELVAAQGAAPRASRSSTPTCAGASAGADRAIAERMLRGAEALARWDPSLALRYARTATLADPSLSRAWAMLGEDAAARGDSPRARALLARAASSLAPADPIANARVGALADALGDVPLAATCLRRAWIAGDDGEAFARLVGALAGRGDVVALSRLLTGAGPVVSAVARAVLAAEQGEDVAPALDGVEASAVPVGALVPRAAGGAAGRARGRRALGARPARGPPRRRGDRPRGPARRARRAPRRPRARGLAGPPRRGRG